MIKNKDKIDKFRAKNLFANKLTIIYGNYMLFLVFYIFCFVYIRLSLSFMTKIADIWQKTAKYGKKGVKFIIS
ncbi:hypothetical protein BC008_44825 [Mastigocoleus testarum BC008]|uniref:Uncharacterized protein n=1 Tax=Mastigocoleus testarum BC008 TaxID=371196 RepID=A0A0V8A0S5_9CYAN|nr:hypothetical protein BC008_44825 [Mastigocoleus testarum BC008]